MRAHAAHRLVGGDWGTQSTRNVKSENLGIGKSFHWRQRVADTKLGEIAHKLLPLLEEFQEEARRVLDEDALRDVTMLRDYMMRKYPRLIVFFACTNILAELAADAPR